MPQRKEISETYGSNDMVAEGGKEGFSRLDIIKKKISRRRLEHRLKDEYVNLYNGELVNVEGDVKDACFTSAANDKTYYIPGSQLKQGH